MTDRRICWLIERYGITRSAYGPYTWAKAVRETVSGHGHYHIVGGQGLTNGRCYPASLLHAAFLSGRIYHVTSQAEAEAALKV